MIQTDEDLTYWRHRTPVGVKVEEISGGSRYSGRVWDLMARQVWSENGREGEYRSVEHADSGMPMLEGGSERISLTHTPGMMAVATLPPTPEVDLAEYTSRAAMGIDAENMERTVSEQVCSRVFSPAEQALVAAAGSHGAIVAWTCKEALYKAVQGLASSWSDDYTIVRMPDMAKGITGEAVVSLPSGKENFILYSYQSGEYVISIALSTRCATFKKETV